MAKDSLQCEHDQQRIVFAGKVIVQKRTTMRIHLERVKKEVFFRFGEVGEVIFGDIFVTTFTQCPENVKRHAEHHLAYLFWGREVCRCFGEANITYNQRIFQEAAYTIAERLHDSNWLLPGLVMEVDQLLPETTERDEWFGARRRILSLSLIERVNLRPPEK